MEFFSFLVFLRPSAARQCTGSGHENQTTKPTKGTKITKNFLSSS